VLAATGGALLVAALVPASAYAVDLFPVDDWLGSGIKKAGEFMLGPLKLGAEEIARLLATIVGALADLLVPKSLVRAGLDGIRWLVQMPPVGMPVAENGAIGAVRMPHLVELKGVLTWLGVTLLPLGLIVGAGRGFLAPSAEGENPAELLERALVAGFGLLVYDWAWGVAVRLSRLLSDALLGLPWVADGVERMLETLVIGGAAGTAVAAEFVIPLLLLAAGGALLALLLLRVALDVITALVYVMGGLALGASVTGWGQRLLAAWLVAAGAVALLPVLWALVFVTGAALMLDSQTAAGPGFGGFVAQLYNVAAALAVFVVAIKLARALLGQAGGAIGRLAHAPPAAAAGGARAAAGAQRWAQHATPAGLARFSRAVRAGAQTAARGAAFPVRHPLTSAGAAGGAAARSVQATRAGADALRASMAAGAPAAYADVARARVTRVVATNGRAATPTSAPTGGAPITPAGSPVGATASGGAPLAAVVGGRRARAAAARQARQARARAARRDWSQPRPLRPPTSHPRPGAGAGVRFAGARPWWLGRARALTRPGGRDDQRRSGGGRRGG